MFEAAIRALRTLAMPALLLAALMPGAAMAQVEVSVVSTGYHSYMFNGGDRSYHSQTPTGDLLSTNDSSAEVRVSYTSTADSEGFYFLHNIFCVGRCVAEAGTDMVFTIFNNTDETQLLRWDSQITPGHLARMGDPSGLLGRFDFRVEQTTGAQTTTLYSTSGVVNDQGFTLGMGDFPFNGLQPRDGSSAGIGWSAFDWSATNIYIDLLAIPPFTSTTLRYVATTRIENEPLTACTTLTDCSGVHVAFGDPRNKGGTSGDASRGFAALAGEEEGATIRAIGSEFYSTKTPFSFVQQGSEKTPDAAPIPITYAAGPPFIPSALAVPEPGTWGMLILGFGMIGGALRRRPGLREARAG